MLAAAILAAFTTVDLAYNNGPNGATALPTATYDVLEPGTRNATIALLKEKVVQNETRRDRIELAGLGFHWPNASLTHGLENTLGYNPLRLGLYSEATGAGDTCRPARPARLLAPVSLLPLHPRRSPGPALHRDGRAGREHGPPPEAGRPASSSPAPRTASSTRTRAAMDRVLFATEARSADFAQMLRDGQWPDVDLRTTVLLEAAPAAAAAAPAGQGAHRELPQHRGGPGGREPRRRLGGAERSLAPLVARRHRRPADGVPARQRPVPGGGGAPGPAYRALRVPPPGGRLAADHRPRAAFPCPRHAPFMAAFSPRRGNGRTGAPGCLSGPQPSSRWTADER